jgi:hypothetical protein
MKVIRPPAAGDGKVLVELALNVTGMTLIPLYWSCASDPPGARLTIGVM